MGIYKYSSWRPEGLEDFDWEVLAHETISAMEFFVDEGDIWDWIMNFLPDELAANQFTQVWAVRPSSSVISNCSVEKEMLLFEFSTTEGGEIPEEAWPVVSAALDKYLDNWFMDGEQSRLIDILDELKADYGDPFDSKKW